MNHCPLDRAYPWLYSALHGNTNVYLFEYFRYVCSRFSLCEPLTLLVRRFDWSLKHSMKWNIPVSDFRIRTCAKRRYLWQWQVIACLHPTDTVGRNYLSLPLIPAIASHTVPVEWCTFHQKQVLDAMININSWSMLPIFDTYIPYETCYNYQHCSCRCTLVVLFQITTHLPSNGSVGDPRVPLIKCSILIRDSISMCWIPLILTLIRVPGAF